MVRRFQHGPHVVRHTTCHAQNTTFDYSSTDRKAANFHVFQYPLKLISRSSLTMYKSRVRTVKKKGDRIIETCGVFLELDASAGPVYDVLCEKLRVLAARNGPEAMRSLNCTASKSPLFFDLQIRYEAGDKFIEWLRQQDAQLPTIVMTGWVGEDTRNLFQQHDVIWLHMNKGSAGVSGVK